MGIRKGNIHFIFIFLVFFCFSCRNQTQERIDYILSFSTKGKISRYEKTEQWISFNGDGYKIESFLITDTSIIDSARLKCIKYDGKWVNECFANSEIYEFIVNTSGYYKRMFFEDQIEYAIIDTTRNLLFYYIIIY